MHSQTVQPAIFLLLFLPPFFFLLPFFFLFVFFPAVDLRMPNRCATSRSVRANTFWNSTITFTGRPGAAACIRTPGPPRSAVPRPTVDPPRPPAHLSTRGSCLAEHPCCCCCCGGYSRQDMAAGSLLLQKKDVNQQEDSWPSHSPVRCTPDRIAALLLRADNMRVP